MILGAQKLPDEEYFAMHAVSNSKLADLAKCPREYWYSWRMVWEETPAMRLGKMFHCFLLEPDEFPRRYFLFDENERPEQDKTMASNANKRWKQSIVATEAMAGRQPYDASEMITLKSMRSAVWDEVAAWALIETPGEFEQAFTWEQDVDWYSFSKKKVQKSLVQMKLKSDKLIRDMNCILDIKTTNDASPKWWNSHAWEYGYHRQAALYSDALGITDFYILAVETKAPYNVALYKADPSLLDKGRNYVAATADPGWGYKPLLEKLCQLRERHGMEFPAPGEKNAKPWPMYAYWAKPGKNGILEWKAPLWT